MLISPFENSKNQVEKKEVSIQTLQRYLVDNFASIITSENIIIIKDKIRDYLYDKYSLSDENEISQITNVVLDNIFGYGILQQFLDNKDVSDIRIIKYDQIFIKIKGKWKKQDIFFKDEDEFLEYIRYVVLKNEQVINYDRPLVVFSDRKNNLRIEAGISPVNVKSPSLVIRIHRSDNTQTLEILMKKFKMLNKEQYDLLIKAVKEKKNIVISGKGGSGKTTLLRALIEKLPNELAIATNEETAELNLEGKNAIQREITLQRGGVSDITLETLTRHSLVSSNDAIIIGELKGSEASVFFDSISTGHLGYATVHSDSAENTIDRLVTLVKRDVSSAQYKEEFIQKLLSKSIDYIIYMSQFKVNQIIKVDYVENKVKNEILYKEEVE